MLLRSRPRSSVATNGEEPPLKKRRKNKNASLELPHTTISSLPDDLVLSCLARVSRLYYPTLSLVSKKFRSFIASPELYKVRSVLGLTESCLYVCLRAPEFGSHWFTLCKRPDTKTKKKQKQPSGDLLVPISSPHSPQAQWSNLVAIGSSIYVIGGFIDNAPSSNVSVLDCRSHAWRQAPNMQAGRHSRGANVVDGKIYVVGGRINNKPSNWIEVFDPETQIWESVSSHGGEMCSREIRGCTSIDGKMYVYGFGECVAYNPKDATFETMEWHTFRWASYSHCVIENVCFRYDPKVFRWYDSNARVWRDLKGLEGIKSKIRELSSVKLADYGGKIAVLWDRHLKSKDSKEQMIWFAEISLERRRNDEEEEDEIWGKVEFLDRVLTVVPMSYCSLDVISATL